MTGKLLQISERRYLGAKTRLLPFITRVLEPVLPKIHVFADLFAGTGVVASRFTGGKIICNDILYCNHICHIAWFGSESASREKLARRLFRYNDPGFAVSGYMAENFSDTYFSEKTCGRIDAIREDIESGYAGGDLNAREHHILLASLLYAMDRIANTCGHYDAWRKNGKPDAALALRMPDYMESANLGNVFLNEDANSAVLRIKCDLAYIDPPYNSRQYSDAYHLLENIARWKKPVVSGVARKMDRCALKSAYCSKDAGLAFRDLIGKTDARYILVSHNDMGERGDPRSQAKLPDDLIIEALKDRGKVTVFEQNFPDFTTGKSDRKIRERLFLCETRH